MWKSQLRKIWNSESDMTDSKYTKTHIYSFIGTTDSHVLSSVYFDFGVYFTNKW